MFVPQGKQHNSHLKGWGVNFAFVTVVVAVAFIDVITFVVSIAFVVVVAVAFVKTDVINVGVVSIVVVAFVCLFV